MTAPTLDFYALNELRTIALLTGDNRWLYRDPRVIGRKLLVALQDAGYIVACDEPGQEWTRDCYRPTAAGMEAAHGD